MRKGIILAALVITAGAAFNVANATEKKKKTQPTTLTAAKLSLETSSDSLSYAAGMTMTDGLLPFLKSNFGVETEQLDIVEEAFKATMANGADPKAKAYVAGQQVAFMVLERMLPKMKEDFAGSKDSIDIDLFTNGFINALKKDYTMMVDTTASKYFDKTRKEVKAAHDAAMRKEGEDFLAANAKKEGVVTLPSGLQYKIINKGTGEIPAANDEVTVKYEGRLINGTVFDSSYKRGDGTAKFRPNQVIKGWKEALTMMPVGSKWELYIPQNLAYGERKSGPIPAFSTLVFTVELVKIDKAEVKKDTEKSASTTNKPAAKTTNSQAKKK